MQVALPALTCLWHGGTAYYWPVCDTGWHCLYGPVCNTVALPVLTCIGCNEKLGHEINPSAPTSFLCCCFYWTFVSLCQVWLEWQLKFVFWVIAVVLIPPFDPGVLFILPVAPLELLPILKALFSLLASLIMFCLHCHSYNHLHLAILHSFFHFLHMRACRTVVCALTLHLFQNLLWGCYHAFKWANFVYCAVFSIFGLVAQFLFVKAIQAMASFSYVCFSSLGCSILLPLDADLKFCFVNQAFPSLQIGLLFSAAVPPPHTHFGCHTPHVLTRVKSNV